MLQEAVTNTFRSASSPQSEVPKQRKMFPFFEKICKLWINKIKQMTNAQFHSKQIISYVGILQRWLEKVLLTPNQQKTFCWKMIFNVP